MLQDLRKRMVADMELAGLSRATQATYLKTVDVFVRRTWMAPEAVEEKDFADYLRQLCGKGVAQGTFRPARYGLQFLFQNTLGRDWPLFEKKSARRGKSVFRRR